jgi:hypothetical protein
MRVDLLVLVDGLEDVGGCGAIGELQLLEGLFGHFSFVALAEVLDRHFSQNMTHFAINVLEV